MLKIPKKGYEYCSILKLYLLDIRLEFLHNFFFV